MTASPAKIVAIGAGMLAVGWVVREALTPGSQAVFPVDKQSVAKVQARAAQTIREGCTADEVHKVALTVLYRAGLTESSPAMDKARALHRFVADSLPYTPDPEGFESMKSPQRVAYLVLSGQAQSAQLDCDDLSLFLAALYLSVGLPASVAFLDTDGDGEIDHAIATVQVNGAVHYAETTVPKVGFGWKPPTKNPPEVLPLSV